MYEALMLLAFGAFVALAAHFIQKLEDKDDADGYNSERGISQDNHSLRGQDAFKNCAGTTGCSACRSKQGAGGCHS